MSELDGAVRSPGMRSLAAAGVAILLPFALLGAASALWTPGVFLVLAWLPLVSGYKTFGQVYEALLGEGPVSVRGCLSGVVLHSLWLTSLIITVAIPLFGGGYRSNFEGFGQLVVYAACILTTLSPLVWRFIRSHGDD